MARGCLGSKRRAAPLRASPGAGPKWCSLGSACLRIVGPGTRREREEGREEGRGPNAGPTHSAPPLERTAVPEPLPQAPQPGPMPTAALPTGSLASHLQLIRISPGRAGKKGLAETVTT